MSCIPTSAFKSKSIINSGSSSNLTSRLYALYGSAANIIFAALSLILNYSSFKLAIAVYKGLPIGHSLLYIPYNP